MICALSFSEIKQVCDNCPDFVVSTGLCQAEKPFRAIIEVRRCKKWDEYYHSTCIFRTMEPES
jgi:hypothetical protein